MSSAAIPGHWPCTGTYAVRYPVIPRPDAHDLQRKLKTLEVKAGRSWLHATLTVKSSKLTTNAEGEVVRPSLPASGMFILSPPRQLPSLPRAQGQLTSESRARMLQDPASALFLTCVAILKTWIARPLYSCLQPTTPTGQPLWRSPVGLVRLHCARCSPSRQ